MPTLVQKPTLLLQVQPNACQKGRLPKRVTTAPWAQKAIGIAACNYLRLVWNTSRFIFEPADLYDRVRPELPVIVAVWHGQHFMTPFL